MTTNQKQQAITKAIYYACPELKQIKFGCLIEYKGRLYPFVRKITRGGGKRICPLTGCKIEHKTSTFYQLHGCQKPVNYKECKAVGHPITLHYVLKTIKQAAEDENVDIFVYNNLCHNLWNFTKPDNLATQMEDNEELVDLLYSLTDTTI